ncbi:paired domain-containing protein [Trichonephila clavipes]|uniref:Paired domain-containing protein n=1 Tax=Trichonephila clavipes TaxID=2585209 RepID=A0A8X6RAX2_TRICX|nr:paired domain-containing protein [Trichonephila clavipes]
MSQRRRLPNSLRWRAVGWMEMGLSQADAARRPNVSRSVVQRLWDQYQSEDSCPEDLFQADHELQHLQKTVFQLFRHEGEEPLLCRSSLQTTFKHQEEESPLLRCEIVFTMQVCMQEDQLCAFPSTDDSEGTAYAGQENMFLGRSNNGLLCCSQTSPDLQWRVIQGVYGSGGNSALDTINPTLLKDTVIEVVESWFGQGSRSVATLTCMCSMEEP